MQNLGFNCKFRASTRSQLVMFVNRPAALKAAKGGEVGKLVPKNDDGGVNQSKLNLQFFSV